MATIGFIGLGNMGLPMARNLVAAGHQVQGYDTNSDLLAAAGGMDIITCASAGDAAEDAQAIILMLPNAEAVMSVLETILPHCAAGSLVMDCSTIDVESARRFHAMLQEAGLLGVDAPVSGGVTGAQAATLTFMAGGTEQAFKTAEPFLDIMGARHVLCGGSGAGQSAKICNNMLLAITMIGTGEAFSLGQKLGLEPEALFQIMSTSSGMCWPINTYCPVPGVGPNSPADNDYKPGFATDLMLKDAGLAQQAAETVGQSTPLGAHALELYREYSASGAGDKDFSAIIQWLNDLQRG